jgi:hypothetical protein
MMRKKRRTEIRIETHETRIIRFHGEQSSYSCEQCLSTITAVTPEQAAGLLEMPLEDVFRAINVGRFHLVGMTARLPLLCGKSLGITENDLMLAAPRDPLE